MSGPGFEMNDNGTPIDGAGLLRRSSGGCDEWSASLKETLVRGRRTGTTYGTQGLRARAGGFACRAR